jgi:hypothetical protein
VGFDLLLISISQCKAEHAREIAAAKEASNSLQTRLDRATGARSEGIGSRGSALLEQILASSPAQVAGDLIRQGKVRVLRGHAPGDEEFVFFGARCAGLQKGV